MAAANPQSSRAIATVVGKLFSNRFSPSPPPASSSSFRRAVHASVYDKNVDELIHPTPVPDQVTEPQSDKYWAPHPKTGVFGPAGEEIPATGISATGNVSEGSVLEEKAFFRQLEDLDKPPPQP